MRKPVGFRLSEPARELLEQLALHHGISKTAVLELLIREQAAERGLPATAAAGAVRAARAEEPA